MSSTISLLDETIYTPSEITTLFKRFRLRLKWCASPDEAKFHLSLKVRVRVTRGVSMECCVLAYVFNSCELFPTVAKSNGVVSHTRSVNRTDSGESSAWSGRYSRVCCRPNCPLDCQKENRQPNVMPQSKRRKKRNSKKIGKLQRLLDSFPLEIMFEVRTVRHSGLNCNPRWQLTSRRFAYIFLLATFCTFLDHPGCLPDSF